MFTVEATYALNGCGSDNKPGHQAWAIEHRKQL